MGLINRFDSTCFNEEDCDDGRYDDGDDGGYENNIKDLYHFKFPSCKSSYGNDRLDENEPNEEEEERDSRGDGAKTGNGNGVCRVRGGGDGGESINDGNREVGGGGGSVEDGGERSQGEILDDAKFHQRVNDDDDDEYLPPSIRIKRRERHKVNASSPQLSKNGHDNSSKNRQ